MIRRRRRHPPVAAGATGAGQALPAEAAEIMATAPYSAARWSYLVVDPETDEVIYSNQADTFQFLASQTKHFTVGTVYNDLGAIRRSRRPCTRRPRPRAGRSAATSSSSASGNLALGRRQRGGGAVRLRHRGDRPRLRRRHPRRDPGAWRSARRPRRPGRAGGGLGYHSGRRRRHHRHPPVGNVRRSGGARAADLRQRQSARPHPDRATLRSAGHGAIEVLPGQRRFTIDSR